LKVKSTGKPKNCNYRIGKIKNQNKEITQQKDEIETQAEELKVVNDKLVELDEYKQSMTGMIVHDLKNPLNAIIGLSYGEYRPQHQKNLHQTGKSMLQLVMNILDVQKFEEAQTQLNLKATNLRNLIIDSLGEVAFLIEEKNQQINVNIEENIWVNVDTILVQRVFVNLLTNAIKFTPLNGQISLYNQSKDEADNSDKVRVFISDSGPGIPEEKQNIIFQKFRQVQSESSGKVMSTGLGLTFCKLVIEAHKGEIGVQSQKEKGATFFFDLPLGTHTFTPSTEKTDKSLEEHIELKKDSTIVLTEEEEVILQPIIEELKPYKVFQVSTIKKILKKIPKTTTESGLEKWKKKLTESLYANNKQQFEELMHVITENTSS